MKILRVILNSALVALAFCFFLALLIQELNFFLPLNFFDLSQITLFLILSYGAIILLGSVITFFLIQFFRGHKIKLAWISPAFLMLGLSLALLVFVVIFKSNIDFFRSFYSPENLIRLNHQQLILIVLSLIGFWCFYLGRRSKNKSIFVYIYFMLLGMSLGGLFLQQPILKPISSTGRGYFEIKPSARTVTLLGLEGLSFDFLIPLADEKKLPNFSWLFEEGSWGQLGSFTPNEPFILNKSLITGKLPAKHLYLSRYKYYLPNLEQPLLVVPRFIFFRQLIRFGLLSPSPLPITSSGNDLWEIIRLNQGQTLQRDWPYDYKTFLPEEALKSFHRFYPELETENSFLFSILKEAFLCDYAFEQKFFKEKSTNSPQLSSLLLYGLNNVEAYYYKFHFPEYFGEISQEDINKYQTVIEKYYQFYDQIIGKYLAALQDNELLIIYSPHGIEPLSLWKRVIEWLLGQAELSADHDLAPDGVVFFFGKEVARGQNIKRISITDLTPTILYFLGLPVARDMDGIVRSSIFTREFTDENPIVYITTYEKKK